MLFSWPSKRRSGTTLTQAKLGILGEAKEREGSSQRRDAREDKTFLLFVYRLGAEGDCEPAYATKRLFRTRQRTKLRAEPELPI